MAKMIIELRRELEEMRGLLNMLVEAVFETDVYEDIGLSRDELRKLTDNHHNLYN